MKNTPTSKQAIKQIPLFKLAPIQLALLLALAAAMGSLYFPNAARAAQLSLAQVPPSNANKPPVPNMVISVDDSGSMGQSGIDTLKSALTQAFSPVNLPDGTVRLAWQTMNGACRTIPSNIGACGNKNAMKLFAGQHRLDFDAFVASLVSGGGTPTHQMMNNAGNYMSLGLGLNNPWASDPGTTELPYLGCRKAYHVLMTDGGWNTATIGGGNIDGTAKTLPDGTAYAPNTSQTRYIGDAWGTAAITTLSDLAWKHWSTDLQPGISNQVIPTIKEPGVATVGATALTQYWNPKNDPATWQHLVTYTLGFNGAADWPIRAGVAQYDTTTYNGDYPALVNGTLGWFNPLAGNESDRAAELWHMALNSRGEFVPAIGAGVQNLVDAFNRIIQTIVTDTSQPLTSIAASASSYSNGLTVYESGYNAINWTGKLVALPITAGTGVVGTTPIWSAATLLDGLTDADMNNRVVLTNNGAAGVPFRYANLSLVQQAAFRGSGNATVGADRVNYIRGERAKEASVGPYRKRQSRLGDIVNSNLWYTDSPLRRDNSAGYLAFRSANINREKMIYVGANDGMLHGFNATTGVEKIAYVPNGLTTQLNPLTDPSYSHRYYMDGNPFTGDANESGWKTFLASGLAGGGKGYFILNVTNPAGFGDAAAAGTVVTDTTATVNPDIGYIYAQPVVDRTTQKLSTQITKLNDNSSYVVMGNGYNSTNERAALIVQRLVDTPPTIIPVELTVGQANGLAAPLVIDLNGDKIPDIAYAGDLKGRIWKFDLTAGNSGAWKVAFSGQPLFTATSPGGVVQPITTTPTWKAHPAGGIMLAFGTGRNLTVADRTDTQVQSIYSVWDKTPYTISSVDNSITFGAGSSNLTRANLVQQTITSTVNVSGQTEFKTSANPVNYSGVGGKYGWMLDLPTKMRAITNANDFNGNQFNIRTFEPGIGGTSVESCDPVSIGKNFFFIFDMFLANNTSKSPYTGGANGVNGLSTVSSAGVIVYSKDGFKVVGTGSVNATGGIDPAGGAGGGGNCPEGLCGTDPLGPRFGGWREIP